MAKYRETPCLFYICEGNCAKGRDGHHRAYCQHCQKYVPRAKMKYKNQKKERKYAYDKFKFDQIG